MRIVTARRIAQVFFFLIFLWFAIVTAAGKGWWQIDGWPVNAFLWSDPLTAIGMLLSTGTFYWPFLIALVVLILTVIFGRFFCGWVCPFGSIHQFTGYLAHRKKKVPKKIALNKYRKWQKTKYYILIILLIGAAAPGVRSLLTGLLDPIPLVSRSFNLALVPLLDNTNNTLSPIDRSYTGAWVITAVFLTFVLLNVVIPRFFCRFVCPLGALFGLFGKFAIFRIGKNTSDCINCRLCDRNCEGGCDPGEKIKINECVLCFNCREDCKHDTISYQTAKSTAGEQSTPDVTRRGFVGSIAAGVFIIPALRLSAKTGENWDNSIIRPPGSLEESKFLERCIKCGQCMKICPTNVIQPVGIDKGLEAMWTPTLNNRIGTSGCQLNCIACSYVCPTAAIRPITLDEKQGTGEFADKGPIKIGTAFVDRNRCLPWAMGIPCIVCQENCPVSPKAIFTADTYQPVRNPAKKVTDTQPGLITIETSDMQPGAYASGDYYLAADIRGGDMVKITANDQSTLKYQTQENNFDVKTGQTVYIKVRLQRPVVDIEKCIGCGICEHECPVSGKRAIRVSADGETRNPERKIFL